MMMPNCVDKHSYSFSGDILMRTSWTKLLAVLTVCSATTLGACAMDDASSGDDATGRDGTVDSDAITRSGAANSSEGEQALIVSQAGIIVNLSVRQWQTDLRAWQMAFMRCRPSVTVDGVFGSMTTTATECFQSNNGINPLTPDGVVGCQTFVTMCIALQFMVRPDLESASNCGGMCN
jgi:peptidoglycan hydrolase-like protein with peptidoglycan-binding domain